MNILNYEAFKVENLAEIIEKQKQLCEDKGLKFEVIESIPVHEDIKLGKPTGTNRTQEKLRKLKELKDNDLISVEDYENKKKQILENL